MLNFLNKRKNKGQSLLEYSVLIIIIIAALFSIQMYIKRGIQGRMKSATDDIGEQFSVGNMNYRKITTTNSNIQDLNLRGVQTTNMLTPEQTNELVNSAIEIMNFEYFGQKKK